MRWITPASGAIWPPRSSYATRWRACVPLEPELMLPAPAQGTIAIQVRVNDSRTRPLVAALDDHVTHVCTTVERLLMHELEGGCRIPLGALATLSGNTVTLHARLSDADGRQLLEETASGSANALPALARQMAEAFRARGAAAILATLRPR